MPIMWAAMESQKRFMNLGTHKQPKPPKGGQGADGLPLLMMADPEEPTSKENRQTAIGARQALEQFKIDEENKAS